MDNLIKNLIAAQNPELIIIGEEYINASEDLLIASKELAEKGDVAIDVLKPYYEGPFMTVWIKDESLKEVISKFGITNENKNFILHEMKEIAKMNRNVAKIIRNKIKELPV